MDLTVAIPILTFVLGVLCAHADVKLRRWLITKDEREERKLAQAALDKEMPTWGKQ
jgi:hypothetical protein